MYEPDLDGIISTCRDMKNDKGETYGWWKDVANIVEEVKFLRFYMDRAYDIFGPADADVDYMIKAEYEAKGNVLPARYKEEE